MNPTANIKQRAQQVLAGAFVLVLALPTICSLCHFQKNGAIDEYRMLATFPGLDASTLSLQVYTKQLEVYFNDLFGGRKFLILCQKKC